MYFYMLSHLSLKKIKHNMNRNIHYLRKTGNIDKILTPGCLSFVNELYKDNIETYKECTELRKKMNMEKNYDFRKDTSSIRDSGWKVNTLPQNLQRRHVEITGPGNNAKMIINAFNSNANGYMLDLEDSMSPTWYNVINAHYNIKKAIRGELFDYKYDAKGNLVKKYEIAQNTTHPTFFTRVRGLHMKEENVIVDGNAVPASFFDIGTYMYHNANYLVENNKGPYLYIPKLELYEEAKLINDLLVQTQNKLSIPIGTAKVTCLIETYPAIFQTEEIIYALKDHISALNCGRWDYLFSAIKSSNKGESLPYRNELNMKQPFLEAYVEQIVKSCHKRGILAIGGMSAFIPGNNKEKNDEILKKIINDKELEIKRGCDGAWVAHPNLVDPVKKLFEDNLKDNNQISFIPTNDIIKENLLPKIDNFIVLERDLRTNINISLQYISAWLSGNGAVALNGLMEDLATSELSIFQIKQWYKNEEEILNDNTGFNLTKENFEKLLDEEYLKMICDNEVDYASRNFELSKKIIKEYVYNDYDFLPDVANKYLNIDNGFKGVKWDKETYHKISGSKGYLSGIELTKYRGEYLNKFLYEDNQPAYKFLGTTNGVSAVNVVAGGNGKVGPYAGGWQHNAMGNRLNMCLPDTLHVAPEESANCAMQINNHLHRADAVQHILKIDKPSMKTVEYYDMAMLCDLEQGWNTPEKTRIATLLAIQNGINVIHIEDQGEKKRCGHLGDKELNNYDDYAIILRSANLAAQELLGPEQADRQWVRFVARTDALSAKRIHYSHKLTNPENPEYKFIDWKAGPTPDGKYLYLKQGINEETGNPWGLDLSIYRGARIVDEGLASHIWMETPDADLHIAKKYMDGVNEILLPKGKKAYSLYNHSPSFDWDIKFFKEAEKLTDKIITWNKNIIKNNNEITINNLKQFLIKEGDLIQGDHLFTKDELHNIILCLNDVNQKEDRWVENLDIHSKNIYSSYHSNQIKEYINKQKGTGYIPQKYISDIIVERRLKNFGNQLSTFGCNLHLITLPEFHVTAYNMHILSNDFSKNGINAFVKNVQRPERLHDLSDHTYTYYKHQTATGTGGEAAFNSAVGSHDVNTLSDSTEQDDLKKRK